MRMSVRHTSTRRASGGAVSRAGLVHARGGRHAVPSFSTTLLMRSRNRIIVDNEDMPRA